MNELFGVIPMTELAVGLALTLAVVLLGIAISGFRNRVFVKLALRNIPRRPAQTSLIVIGLMLSTMIIAASLGVGDTVTNSIRSFVVVDGLGHTDEVIRSPTFAFLGDDYLDGSQVDAVRDAVRGDDRVDGVLPLIVETLPITNTETSRTEARADVRGFDVESLAGFGDLESVSGQRVSLVELGDAEVYLNKDAANVLAAGPGDAVVIVTPTGRHDFVVRDVLDRGGLAGTNPRVLMRLAQMQQIMGREGQVNRVDISNAGGVMDGLDLSDEVTDHLRLLFTDFAVADELFELLRGDEIASAIEGRIESADLPAGLADDLLEIAGELRKAERSDRFTILMADDLNAIGVMAALERAGREDLVFQAAPLALDLPLLRVTDIKANLVELAEFFGTIFTLFFMIFGSFSIIVGLLLIFLVFVLLAAAREQEMGMARAIGTKRGHLVRLFTFEGTAYALLAGLIGTALGIIAAFLLVTILNSIFSEEDNAFSIRASFEARSIVVAFCAGVLLTLATVAVSAYRVSKLTIVTAIRGLPEEMAGSRPRPLRRRFGALGWSLVAPVHIVYEEMISRGWGQERGHRRVVGFAVAYVIVTFAGFIALGAISGIPILAIFGALGVIWFWWVVKPLFRVTPIVQATSGGTLVSGSSRGINEPRGFWWLLIFVLFIGVIWIKRVLVAAWQLIAPWNRTGAPALVFGLGIALLAVSASSTPLWSIGATVFLIGVGQFAGLLSRTMHASRGVSGRISTSASSGLVLIFWSLPFDSLEALTGELDGGIEMFILSGVFMVGSAVWLVMNNADIVSRFFEQGLGRFGSMKPVIRTSIAYPLAAKFRTGLTIAMFSLVIFTLIVFAILNAIGNVLEDEPDRVTGGYDIRATISRDLPISDVAADIGNSRELSISDFEVITGTGEIRGEARQVGAEEIGYARVQIRGLDEIYLDTSLVEFTHRDPLYGTTDREIWARLAEDPTLAVMNGQAIVEPDQFDGPQPEQFKVEGITNESDEDVDAITVQVRAPGGRGNVVERTVIAYMDNLANLLDVSGEAFDDGSQISTIFSAPGILEDVAGRPVPITIYQFRLAQPARAEEIAAKLETVFLDHSMEADSAQTLIDTNQQQGDAFNLLFQGFMSLGLLVGVASLGVISFRAVVERRQSIGMMRALGYKGWMIQAGFLFESSVIALLGITIGIGLGSVISYNIVQEIGKEIEGLKFNMPWINVMVIVAISWSFAMVTTYWPARQASRIYPSEALRYE
ncbi:MAG: FtsX-like permease family protein [Chloroflexi bacterium]|nr:FtsX-like permease family protein [Chloroflexota bacterium]